MSAATMKEKARSSEELRRIRDHERELRRLSGEIACANCRRLKLKCDKKIPCSACVKRGTTSFCPLGSGASGGNHDRHQNSPKYRSCYYCQRWKQRSTLLIERIRILEDALALESEARGGSGRHPLLTDELLAIKRSLTEDESDSDGEEENPDELLDAFGTLSIDDSKTMRYLGPAASESALLMEVLENTTPRLSITGSSPETPYFSREIIHSSRSFPFSPLFLDQSKEVLLAQLVCYLPPFARATALYEAFFRNLSWFLAPVERSHFVSEIIPLFYPQRRPVTPGNVRVEHAHDFALLFALFACGAVGDLTQSPANSEAEQYCTLAKAALGVRSIMQGASLTGVQTLFLLSAYDVYTGEKESQEDGWKIMTLGSCMAASIGLHRDPSHWGFDTNMIERRRRVFWEIYLIDTGGSLESGRPPIFRPSVADCEFPSDVSAVVGEGEVIESVTQWRFRFWRDVVSEVCEEVTSARPLRYRDVLELDRKIRHFQPHPLTVNNRPQDDHLGIDAEFRKVFPFITVWDKEESLMYIHRNFFAKALLDFPDNPMRSPFAASFLSTYRSASNVIRIVREHMHVMYLHVLRIWHVWTLTLACGVILGAVASLGTSVSFATSAFIELEYTITLFEKYPGHKVAKHGLPLLRRIREKALTALRQPGQRPPTTDTSVVQRAVIPTIRKQNGDSNDELLILRGITRIVEQRDLSSLSGNDSSLSLDQNVISGIRTPTKSSHFYDSPGPSNPPSAREQEASIEGVREAQSSRMDTLHSAAAGFYIPQADPEPWLTELENFLGPAGALQQPVCSVQPDASGRIPGGEPENTYPSQSASTARAPYFSTDVPMPFSPETDDGTTFPRDALLNETVSTGEWSQFMQQSGFCNTPLFDFNFDSFTPLTQPTASDQQTDPARTS